MEGGRQSLQGLLLLESVQYLHGESSCGTACPHGLGYRPPKEHGCCLLPWCCRQTSLTKEQFKAQLLDVDIWEVCDGGVADALEDGKAFLDLAERSCPEVVILQEGCVDAHQARLGQLHQQG